MWLDVRAKLAEIEARPPATTATPATKPADPAPRVAEVASVATPLRPKSQPAPPARTEAKHTCRSTYRMVPLAAQCSRI